MRQSHARSRPSIIRVLGIRRLGRRAVTRMRRGCRYPAGGGSRRDSDAAIPSRAMAAQHARRLMLEEGAAGSPSGLASDACWPWPHDKTHTCIHTNIAWQCDSEEHSDACAHSDTTPQGEYPSHATMQVRHAMHKSQAEADTQSALIPPGGGIRSDPDIMTRVCR